MAQYTNTVTGFGGIVTNSVLNTTTNTQTITVTAPTGQVATATVDPQFVNSNFDNIVTNIYRQLSEQGADVGLRGITQGVNSTSENVTQQQQKAIAISDATGNTTPQETQAIPVSPADNPNPTPNPDVVVTPVLDTPPPTTDPDVNPETLAAQEGLVTPEVQKQISADETAYAETDALAASEGLIVPSVQKQISSDEAAYAETDALAASEGLITPSVQKQISADETAYAETGALAASEGLITPSVSNSIAGLSASKLNAQSQATQQDTTNFQQQADWRVRLRLSPGASYLYKDPNIYATQSILIPLIQTDGVIFPYTPSISVSYAASYAPTDVTHSNYTFFSYQNSKVDSINITCDFTAQDTSEANYLLAVIHFFRSATKMFYGQDNSPRNGTPPPLCYLSGLGAFQFDEHPLAITGFTYSLPIDVDYIRAGIPTTDAGVNKAPQTNKQNTTDVSGQRAANNGLFRGGGTAPPKFSVNYSTREPTYVPTKINLSITAVPIVTRNDISNNFSLKEYATGALLRGSKRAGGGIW